MATHKRRLDRIEDHICDCFGSDTPNSLDRRWMRFIERGQHFEQLRLYFARKEAERLATFHDTKDRYALKPRDVALESTTSDPAPGSGSPETNPAGS